LEQVKIIVFKDRFMGMNSIAKVEIPGGVELSEMFDGEEGNHSMWHLHVAATSFKDDVKERYSKGEIF